MSGDIAEMWQRHLVAAGDDASATSVRVMPSVNYSLDADETGASIRRTTLDGTQWDEKMNSVVDALQDMIAQSPNTPDTHSPEAPWFTDREGYTETALSSPQNSSWSRTIAPPKKQRPASLSFRGVDDGPTHSTKADFNSGSARDCRIEKGKGKGKGRGVGLSDDTKSNNNYTLDPEPFSDWYRDHAMSMSRTTQQKLILTSQDKGYYTMPAAPETATAIYSDRRRGGAEQKATPPPDEVHVLVLTWAKHDRRGDDGQLLSPGLDTDTDTVRACFKHRGYRVQCRLIPDDYPTAAVETMLDRFLSSSSPSTLLVIYYHGFGSMERDRMVFSSRPGGSFFYWDDVRDPIMQAPGDVLLVLDCSAVAVTVVGSGQQQQQQPEVRVETGLAWSPSTKQVLGVCALVDDGKGTSTGSSSVAAKDFMTQALCRTLDRFQDGGAQTLSVQNLCSYMREDLRQTETETETGTDTETETDTVADTDLATRVFVTQLGGGQLLDIYLPRL